jgi:predicted phosphoribosyltransferase
MSERKPPIIERADLRGRTHVFADRADAGGVLAAMLAPRFDARPGALVLAVPAGGVPVSLPIAQQLALPLDVAVVSKITLPWSTESGYGAVAFDGSVHLNEPLVRRLGLSEAEVEAGVARTREKVMRRVDELRGERSYAAIAGSDAVLVDDGLASGFTMRAAIAALRAAGAARVTVAAPTAYESSARAIAGSVEAIYCANVRTGRHYAVADAYATWSDVDEATARTMLAALRTPGQVPDQATQGYPGNDQRGGRAGRAG